MSENIPIEEQRFAELTKILSKNPKIRMERIQRAFDFARKAHDGQFRMSGEPYICHPVETAKILAQLGVDEDTLITGLLHDVPEDTKYTVNDVEKRFGKKVAQLVDALTKLSKVHYKHSMDERQIRSLRKMFLETANDVRVVVVKLADRLHNMQTLRYLRPDKQQRIARETLKIYAPLANLFGIYQVRRQLEDICFKILQPEEHSRIEAFIQDHEKKRSHFIQDTIQVLKKNFKKAEIDVEITGRPKHYYSIYQKMIRDDRQLSDIYDYFALRILTNSREDCYRAIDVIHQTFKPKPKRFKDYIAVPKVNGYQSLHTAVVGLKGRPTEIQIRTQEMHFEAEYGAAAHLLYKNELSEFVSNSVDLLKKYRNPGNFIRSLEEDILQDRIYVFTSEGNVINLPEGATCLDYMFSMDFPVGKKTCRAVVNGQAYSLVGQLQSGDHVDVLVSDEKIKGPERWWLSHVRTTLAKKKLRDHFSHKSFEQRVELGRELLQQELDHEQQALIHQLSSSQLNLAIKDYEKDDFASVLADIGGGTLLAKDVYKTMFPDITIPLSSLALRKIGKLISKMDLAQRFNIGHRSEKYRIRIRIDVYDRVGLIQEIAKPCYQLNIPILRYIGRGHDTTSDPMKRLPSGVRIPMNEDHIGQTLIEVHIENHEELIALFDRLEKIPGVVRIQRVFRRKQIYFFFMLTITSSYVVGHPFLLMYLKAKDYSSEVGFFTMIYGAIAGVFLMLLLLRSMGNKTFPHFEETKLFWPFTFGLTIALIITQFVNDHVFDLHLHTPFLIALSVIGLVFLLLSYRSHVRRKTPLIRKLSNSK
ncbi:MAG: guanosine-3',5'-bis(diphosphate) 3'-pyrophosphohydrolase [Oceanicoccus sp.]|jgi:guanosine-3',5'-bis(diphosphate) 3'-pyrophosphohydrolase